MLDYDLGLLAEVVGVKRCVLGQSLRGSAFGELRVVSGLLGDVVVGVVVGVVPQHIEYEPFLDGLAHTVNVERFRMAADVLPSEKLDGLALRRGRESEERQVRLRAA